MARDSANALILSDLHVYMADVGSTMPTDTTTALDAAFKEVGWINPDGFSETPQGSVTELKGVTGATLARIKDADGWQFEFTCLESNDTTDSLLYPNATTATATGITTSTVKASTAPPQKAFVIEATYSNGSKRRIGVPLGNATVSGAVSQKYTDFRQFPVQVDALQASDGTLLINITDNAGQAVA